MDIIITNNKVIYALFLKIVKCILHFAHREYNQAMDISQLKQKIIDDSKLVYKDKLIERELSITFMPKKANVITGARRIGKTSQMRLLARKLAAEGVPREKICYMSFFEDSFIDSGVMVSQIEKAYYELHPEYYNDDDVIFLFDEVQMLSNWGAGIAALMERHPVRVIITGSSARYLSFDIATELRGRTIVSHFYPLSFMEFMAFNGMKVECKAIYSSEEEAGIRKMFWQYLERGSYPELATISDKVLRNMVLSSYFDLMFSRDLIERFEIAKASELRALMRRVIKTSSSPQSLKRLEHMLASSGHKLSEPTISTYLMMMEEAAIISPVPCFGNEKIQKANPTKYYAVDHAIVRYLNEFTPMKGTCEEIMVHAHLLRVAQERGMRIFYHRTAKDYEADFVIADDDLQPFMIVQVTDDFTISREREIRGMLAAMEELSLYDGYIISSESSEEQVLNGRRIHVMPIWRFLLMGSNVLIR